MYTDTKKIDVQKFQIEVKNKYGIGQQDAHQCFLFIIESLPNVFQKLFS